MKTEPNLSIKQSGTFKTNYEYYFPFTWSKFLAIIIVLGVIPTGKLNVLDSTTKYRVLFVITHSKYTSMLSFSSYVQIRVDIS